MLLSELVRTSEAVAGAPGRRAKIDELAGCCAVPSRGKSAWRWPSCPANCASGRSGWDTRPSDLIRPAVPASGPDSAEASSGRGRALTLGGLDDVFAVIGAVTGPGTQAERRRLLADLFARATPAERSFLGAC